MALHAKANVEGLRDGDPEAAAHVVRLVAFVIRDRAWAISPSDRPDVTQQVLIDVWRALVDPDFAFEGNLDTLVRTVAYRRCVDWLRRDRPTAVLAEEPPGSPQDEPEGRLVLDERRRQGRRILAQLSDPCRALMQLRVGEGMKLVEIAKLQGRTEDALRSQFYKCLKTARSLVENQLGKP